MFHSTQGSERGRNSSFAVAQEQSDRDNDTSAEIRLILPEKEFPMTRLLAAFTLLLFATLTFADDWPAWRGPTGQGQCFEKNLPLKWSDKENVKWKVKLEMVGNSTPIVWKDKIFLTMAKKGGNLRRIVCLD